MAKMALSLTGKPIKKRAKKEPSGIEKGILVILGVFLVFVVVFIFLVGGG